MLVGIHPIAIIRYLGKHPCVVSFLHDRGSFPFVALITLFIFFNSKHLMKLLPQKSQVLKPFQDLVSDSNDKKVLSNPIVLFFGGLVALVILGDIFFKYSGYQTIRFPLF